MANNGVKNCEILFWPDGPGATNMSNTFNGKLLIYQQLENLYNKLYNLTDGTSGTFDFQENPIILNPKIVDTGTNLIPEGTRYLTQVKKEEPKGRGALWFQFIITDVDENGGYEISLEPINVQSATAYYIEINEYGPTIGQSGRELLMNFVVSPDDIDQFLDTYPQTRYPTNIIQINFCNVGDDDPIPPTAPICFIRDTPVKTDQGEVKIQEINTDIHTINGKKILTITKTKLDGDLLVRVEKNAFAEDCPNHSVVMSGNHKILYNNELIMAKDLALNMPDKLNYMKYMGDTLYNVLMENHETMMVNNMVVETLHPENKIALLYRCLLKCNNKEKIETINKYAELTK